MSKVTRIIIGFGALLVTLHVLGERAGAQARRARYLDRVTLTVENLSQVERHFVYSFRVANGTRSRVGVALFGIDLSAPPGTGHERLPATGEFRHSASRRIAVVPRDHVPAGPISPAQWKASLDVDARLEWWGVNGGRVDEDSIAPGRFVDGFGVRSTYLPGIRDFWADPTWQSCCSRPKPGSVDGEHPTPSEFRSSGRTVAPSVRPSDMTLSLLTRQLGDACGLGWVASDDCRALGSILEGARRDAADANNVVATAYLARFVAALEERWGNAAIVVPNAYWLLRTNATYLISHFRR